jgi:hypothetical protein
VSSMRQELEIAKELIEEKQYERAKQLLRKIQSDPTAQKWLDKLDAMAPAENHNGNGTNVAAEPWMYAALEVKRSYGIQYKVNGESKTDWKDQPIYYTLNELGREGWELIGFESINEFSTYILKRRGILENKKIDVWDQ